MLQWLTTQNLLGICVSFRYLHFEPFQNTNRCILGEVLGPPSRCQVTGLSQLLGLKWPTKVRVWWVGGGGTWNIFGYPLGIRHFLQMVQLNPFWDLEKVRTKIPRATTATSPKELLTKKWRGSGVDWDVAKRFLKRRPFVTVTTRGRGFQNNKGEFGPFVLEVFLGNNLVMSN